MDATMLKVATVDSPTAHILKAKATLTENHLTVYDRRTGRAIIDIAGSRVESPGNVWTYFTEDGEITVSKQGGCGCGGTIIQEKHVTS